MATEAAAAAAPPGASNNTESTGSGLTEKAKKKRNKRKKTKAKTPEAGDDAAVLVSKESVDGATTAPAEAAAVPAVADNDVTKNDTNSPKPNNENSNVANGGLANNSPSAAQSTSKKNKKKNKNKNKDTLATPDASPPTPPADGDKIKKDLESKLDLANDTIEKLMAKGKILDGKLTALTDELSAANSKLQSMATDTGERGNDDLATLKVEAEKLEKLKADCALDWQKEKEGLEKEIAALKENASEGALKATVTQLESEKNDLTSKLEALERSNKENEGKAGAATDENALLKSKVAELEQELQKAHQEQVSSGAVPAADDSVAKVWQDKLVAKAKELKDAEKRLKVLESDKRELETRLEKIAVDKKPWWLCF
jgi:hypothetical protein